MKDTVKILQDVMKSGLDEAEVVNTISEEICVSLKNSAVYSFHSETNCKIYVRAFKEKRKGEWRGEVWEEGFAKEIKDITLHSEPDPDFSTLPFPKEYSKVEGIYDEKISQLRMKEVLSLAEKVLKKGKASVRDIVISGEITRIVSRNRVVNSHGVRCEEESTFLSLEIEGIKWEKGEAGSSFDFWECRRMQDFQWEEIVERVVKNASKSVKKKKISTGIYPLILSPLSTFFFLRTLASHLNAENVQKKRSFFQGKLGKKVASEILTLHDDALIPGGLYSFPFDGEGVPHRRVCLIEKGILQTYLHNSYTSGKDKVKNTAHALPGGGIAPTNLIVKMRKGKVERWIKNMEKGIFVEFVGISPHPITGDFSQPLDFAFFIEKGEIKEALKRVMIGGNFLDLLSKLKDISEDGRDFPGNPSPYLLIEEIQVSGEE